MTDWRMQGQERYLANAVLVRQKYRKYRNTWDHDHCEFCGVKFSEDADDITVGYATVDRYHWICEACYVDFRKSFGWIVRDLSSESDETEVRPDAG